MCNDGREAESLRANAGDVDRVLITRSLRVLLDVRRGDAELRGRGRVVLIELNRLQNAAVGRLLVLVRRGAGKLRTLRQEATGLLPHVLAVDGDDGNDIQQHTLGVRTQVLRVHADVQHIVHGQVAGLLDAVGQVHQAHGVNGGVRCSQDLHDNREAQHVRVRDRQLVAQAQARCRVVGSQLRHLDLDALNLERSLRIVLGAAGATHARNNILDGVAVLVHQHWDGIQLLVVNHWSWLLSLQFA